MSFGPSYISLGEELSVSMDAGTSNRASLFGFEMNNSEYSKKNSDRARKWLFSRDSNHSREHRTSASGKNMNVRRCIFQYLIIEFGQWINSRLPSTISLIRSRLSVKTAENRAPKGKTGLRLAPDPPLRLSGSI
jgi:hypothetical protein